MNVMPVASDILLLTESGLLGSDGRPAMDFPVQDRRVTAGHVRSRRLAVCVDYQDVWTFGDGAWTKTAESDVRMNCLAWTRNGRLLAGTEAARLGWVADGGIDFIESFDAIPERPEWNTPWGGPPDTRSLAVAADGTLYADIHVGWVTRSVDGGATWQCLRSGLEKDVHQVGTHPQDAAIVYAATARGFHISFDRGESFSARPGAMPYFYQRACASFPDKPVCLASTSRGPHGQADALLYRSGNWGESWDPAIGLPKGVCRNIDTFQLVTLEDDRAFVLVENRDLYSSADAGESWSLRCAGLPRTYALLENPAE